MEYQLYINVTIAIVGALGGWMLNRVFTLIDRLDKDVRDMPKQYVSKEDYRNDIREMKAMLSKIVDKMEGKVDK